MPKIDLETYEAIKQRLIDHGNAVLVELSLDSWFEIRGKKYKDSSGEFAAVVVAPKVEFESLFDPDAFNWPFQLIPSMEIIESVNAAISVLEEGYRNEIRETIASYTAIIPEYIEGLLKISDDPIIEEKIVVFLDSITIGNFFAIQQTQTISLDGIQEVYFLGENGDGKTLVLLGMHLAFNRKRILLRSNEDAGAAKDLVSSLQLKSSIEFSKLANKNPLSSGLEDSKEPKVVLIGTSEKQKDAFSFSDDANFKTIVNFFAYGANRNRCDAERFDRTGFMSLYNGRIELYSPIALLKQAYLLELEHVVNERNAEPERKILPKWLPVKQIEGLFSELLDGKVTIETSSQGVRFKEKGATVEFEQLSEGFKCIMIWVADLLYRLQTAMPLVGDLERFRGIAMVDEIELHLHPAWQTTLVKKLRRFFPGIQFIFTTHSPTMIQGASDDAVIFKVSRDIQTGATSISEPYYKKDLDRMMFNTLMTSPLFGLESARISPEKEDPDTSESFLSSRIAKQVELRLQEQKKDGKPLMTEAEIDALINEVMNLELNK